MRRLAVTGSWAHDALGTLARRGKILLWIFRHVKNRRRVIRHIVWGAPLTKLELMDGRVIRAGEDYDLWNHFSDIWLHDSYQLAHLAAGDISIIDVGANVGVFSLRASDIASRVIAFEPDPGNYVYLGQNVGSKPTIELDRRAVGGSPGKRVLLDGPGPTGRCLGGPPNDRLAGHGSGHTVVDTVTLSRLLDEYNVVSTRVMLKLDCEGAEFEIVAAADIIVLQRIDRIVIEYHEAPGRQVEAIVGKLTRSGFNVCLYKPRFQSGMLLAERR